MQSVKIHLQSGLLRITSNLMPKEHSHKFVRQDSLNEMINDSSASFQGSAGRLENGKPSVSGSLRKEENAHVRSQTAGALNFDDSAKNVKRTEKNGKSVFTGQYNGNYTSERTVDVNLGEDLVKGHSTVSTSIKSSHIPRAMTSSSDQTSDTGLSVVVAMGDKKHEFVEKGSVVELPDDVENLPESRKMCSPFVCLMSSIILLIIVLLIVAALILEVFPQK